MMMIQRRQFLILGSLLGLSSCLQGESIGAFEKDFRQVEAILSAVQEHMFPEDTMLPSAKKMKTSDFLLATMKHKSFDKDIKAYVLEGAKELEDRNKKSFIKMTYTEKETALRAYEETNYGSNWLSRIMTMTMEGMFCDPIYGSNIKEEGWKSISAYGGFPRPKIKYMGL